MKKIFFIFLVFMATLTATGQDSSRLRISLLTCTPGEELYSTFGHSALRVIDSNAVTDIIYNYGTFDFNDPDFYSKFIKGKLLYCLSIEPVDDFLFSYQMEDRGVREQVLKLTGPEKIAIRQALLENLKEENRWYKYDFVLDNCTTRLRDIILKYKHPVSPLPPVMPVQYTFRNAIHLYLDKNKKYWSKLGIDLLLGARMDKQMTVAQQEFLPDNLMIALDSARPEVMVQSSRILYTPQNPLPGNSGITPLVCFTLLLMVFILFSFLQWRSLLRIADFTLFFLVGLLGILLVFMWWGTDHIMTKENYNLLWALPTHTFFAFTIRKQQKGFKLYFLVTAILMGIILLSWYFLPQQLNIALIPIVILLLYRSIAIFKN